MAARLETLESGTPVYCGEIRVGDVRGVYAEGNANLAEYLVVHWDDRERDVLVATRDVEGIEERGVVLLGSDPQAYESLAAFEPQDHPTIRKIR